jgi:hypothetical protein
MSSPTGCSLVGAQLQPNNDAMALHGPWAQLVVATLLSRRIHFKVMTIHRVPGVMFENGYLSMFTSTSNLPAVCLVRTVATVADRHSPSLVTVHFRISFVESVY